MVNCDLEGLMTVAKRFIKEKLGARRSATTTQASSSGRAPVTPEMLARAKKCSAGPKNFKATTPVEFEEIIASFSTLPSR